MRKREIYLTAVLLVLIGVVLGTIITLFNIEFNHTNLSDVTITEIKRTEYPHFTDNDLKAVDARFVFKEIAEEVTPTVVYIETITTQDLDEENPNLSDEFWDKLIPKKARTVGSGILISQNGYILTNNHVIEGAIKNGINVILNDKREYTARLVGQDPSTDLAVIKIDAKNLPSILIGNSDSVDVGEWVLAIGNPFRLRSTVTAGIVLYKPMLL